MKRAYIIVVVIFYASVVAGINSSKIALLIRGYGTELAFERYDSNDREMINKHYYAYADSVRTITLLTRTAMVIWVVALLFSIYVASNKLVALPYRLEIVTLIASSIVVVLFILLPFLLFGNGPPPSPL
jgi:hypothetical protein